MSWCFGSCIYNNGYTMMRALQSILSVFRMDLLGRFSGRVFTVIATWPSSRNQTAFVGHLPEQFSWTFFVNFTVNGDAIIMFRRTTTLRILMSDRAPIINDVQTAC